MLERDAERRRIRVLVPVHYAGQPCAMERLMPLAERYGLAVVEDAAHALPAQRLIGDTWRRVGTIGDFTAFSFYATKTITTGEGGMITCERDEKAELLRSLRLHGLSGDAWKRYKTEGSWRYDVARTGYKDNMPDVLAAIGVEQLKRADELAAARAELVELYREGTGTGRRAFDPSRRRGAHAARLAPLRDPAARVLAAERRGRGAPRAGHRRQRPLSAGASALVLRRDLRPSTGGLPGRRSRVRRTRLAAALAGMSTDDIDYVSTALRELLETS